MQSFTFFVEKKYTVWEKELHTIEADSEEAAQKKMVEIFKSDQLDETLIEIEPMNDTLEWMTPNENDGFATSVLFSPNDIQLADNATK